MRHVLVLVALLAAGPARPAQAVAVSVEELSRTSEAVIRGRVAAASSRWSDDRLRISTTYEIRADEVLRGQAPAVVRVVVPGGVVGDVRQVMDAAPRLAVGEDLVVFLRRTGAGTYYVAELAQGKFAISGKTARPDLSRFTFVGSSARAGERRSEEMPLAELERRVRSTR